jgi:hypothetical protein
LLVLTTALTDAFAAVVVFFAFPLFADAVRERASAFALLVSRLSSSTPARTSEKKNPFALLRSASPALDEAEAEAPALDEAEDDETPSRAALAAILRS